MWRFALLLGACGRLGFDAGERADGGATGDDGNTADVAIPMSGEVTFGDVPGVTVPGGASDTFLDSSTSAIRGSDPTLLADTNPPRVMLLRFDVQAVPPTRTVQSAQLELRVLNYASSADNDVFAVLEDWFEGEASWAERSAGVGWSAAGAAPPARDTTVLATFPAQVKATAITIPLPAPLVQAWISTPASNMGVVIVPRAGGFSAATREGTTGAFRPLLRVVLGG